MHAVASVDAITFSYVHLCECECAEPCMVGGSGEYLYETMTCMLHSMHDCNDDDDSKDDGDVVSDRIG